MRAASETVSVSTDQEETAMTTADPVRRPHEPSSAPRHAAPLRLVDELEAGPHVPYVPTTSDPAEAAWPFPRAVTFSPCHRGPDGMANGGWVAGTLAGLLPGAPVTVTLRSPAPLDQPLNVVWDGSTVRLREGAHVVAEATRQGTVWSPPAPASLADARRAQTRFAGLDEHPFPGCYVCGTERGDDALRIFPGPVAGRPGVVAAPWAPREHLAADDGRIDERALWAALDCPTGWAHFRPGGVAVLGRLTGQVLRRPAPDEPCAVVARRSGREGRKLWAASAVYGADGSLLAAGSATWVDLQGRLPGVEP